MNDVGACRIGFVVEVRDDGRRWCCAEPAGPIGDCGIGSLVHLVRGERVVRWRDLLCLLALAAGLSACQEPDYTPEQKLCIASRYAAYDARQLNQCVDVCRVCMKGNVVTCNTSCRLRGAS